nr:MAG TPA: hypothetical protein [Caudoviricetes sp.]
MLKTPTQRTPHPTDKRYFCIYSTTSNLRRLDSHGHSASYGRACGQ